MFDSGIKVKDLIDQIKDEADISAPISDDSYILWITALEQLLYTEIIKEQSVLEVAIPTSSEIDLSELQVASGESPVRFENIHAVYADRVQLIKSTAASGVIFPNTYYKQKNGIGLNIQGDAKKLRIVYFVRPSEKSVSRADTETVKLPIEFIDLVKARLRGEAYKVANEDNLAAKWIGDYNTLLEAFKTWIAEKQAAFGL